MTKTTTFTAWCLAATLFYCVSTPAYSDTLPSGITQLETATAKPDSGAIAYRKYLLANGLTLILTEDHSDPLVHVDLSYHVGSAREHQGQTGFAHLFEHMMFAGTQHLPGNQFFAQIQKAGGSMNGTTDTDRTHYFETVPANYLERVLWMESDRMAYLLPALNEKSFETARAAVKNERQYRTVNRPYGQLFEKLSEAIYPRTHPYSWPVVGYMDDLDRENVNQLKDFFLRWYGPNNATLTIGGDIDIAQTLKWVNRYFGSIPKGPLVRPLPRPAVKIDKTRFISYQDNVKQPLVAIAWPTSFRGAQDTAAQQLLIDQLNTRLYRELVQPGKVAQAQAQLICREIGCLITISALPPAKDTRGLKPTYRVVMASLERFAKQPIDMVQFKSSKQALTARHLLGYPSVSSRVNLLAYNQLFYDDPNWQLKQYQRSQTVTPEQIKSVFKHYIYDKPAVVLSIVPHKHPRWIAAKDNYQPAPRSIQKLTAENELPKRSPHDSFDRATPPPIAKSVVPRIPTLYREKMANGLPVLGTHTDETATTQLVITLPFGSANDPTGKEGLTAVLEQMLNQDTQQHPLIEFEQQLDAIGGTINSSFDHNSFQWILQAPSRYLPQLMNLFMERIHSPKLTANELIKAKRQIATTQVQQLTSPASRGALVAKQILFQGTALAKRSYGTQKSLDSITLQDAQQLYRSHFQGKHLALSSLVVVSDRQKANLMKALSPFAQWRYQPSSPVPVKINSSKPTIYLVDQPGAVQSNLQIVRRTQPFDATGAMFKLSLANFIFGGNDNYQNWLNYDLREKKGYTYGAYSQLNENQDYGYLLLSTDVRRDVTGKALLAIRSLLQRASSDGFAKDEITFMRSAYNNQRALVYETPLDKLNLLYTIQSYGLPVDFMEKQNQIIQSISSKQLKAIAHDWLNADDFSVIVVGDAKQLKPQLAPLHWPIRDFSLTP